MTILRRNLWRAVTSWSCCWAHITTWSMQISLMRHAEKVLTSFQSVSWMRGNLAIGSSITGILPKKEYLHRYVLNIILNISLFVFE